MNEPIYLDYNATTPTDPIVVEAMLPFLSEKYGNPSSNHYHGSVAKQAVIKARKQVADMLNCTSDEIIFTSGGTESNNLAIRGIANSQKHRGKHIITSAIEHPSVLEVCRYLEQQDFTVTYLPVDKFGLISLADLEKSINPETILITIMHSNNEIGTIEPIEGVAEIAHKYGVAVHTDCAQSIGKVPVDACKLKVDLMTIAGHKFYAPKGVGALYINSNIQIEKLTYGADHEMDIRPGTENVLEIAGLGAASQLVNKKITEYNSEMTRLRDFLEDGLKSRCTDILINGHPLNRLPNTLSVSFKNLEADRLLSELNNLAVSAGAACHSDKIEISHVLTAMGVPNNYAMGTLRFSVGRNTTQSEIEFAIEEVSRVSSNIQSKRILHNNNYEEDNYRLTKYTHGPGCACKLKPQILQELLNELPLPNDNRILIGPDKYDDAAVFKIDDQQSIIQTVDFFTPIVDDPFNFGAIASTNALSDIYAMGGKPLFALNIVAFPSDKLPTEILHKIIEGAKTKADEANISIIGGHSILDDEPKFGLVVTGLIENKGVISNSNSKPGDVLILTKPIGTGILSSAMHKGLLDKEDEKILIDSMLKLNKLASESMVEVGVNSATDITGFGLMGHLLEMMNASNTSALIEYSKINLLPNVLEFAVEGIIPKGTIENNNFTETSINYSSKISLSKKMILNDVQTSGGLLISCEENKSQTLLDTLIRNGILESVMIGRIVKKLDKAIEVSL